MQGALRQLARCRSESDDVVHVQKERGVTQVIREARGFNSMWPDLVRAFPCKAVHQL